ncbi:hypothetical protein ACFQH9_02220 [Pseudonocardia lutea]|uniref:Uncharacterized protein n=1 Tax=Pseudonocardia lutea TaxID=2172015 RepID=A0ABW1I0E8_9PSEU
MPDLWYLAFLLAYPVYVLLMAGVLRLCGVPKADVAAWALKHADRQRVTELLRVARGLPSATLPEAPPAELPSAEKAASTE